MPDPHEPHEHEPLVFDTRQSSGATPSDAHGGYRASRPTPDEKPTKKRRVLRRVLVSFLVIALLATGGIFYVLHKLAGNVHSITLKGPSQAISDAAGKPLNILLIGSDARDNAADCKLGGDCAIKSSATSSSSASTGIATSSSMSATASGASGTSTTTNPYASSNADVEMLIHLSADRKRAQVISIPRDTVVDVPACTAPSGQSYPARRDRINSALQASPDCQVQTVEKLTGLSIPHVALIDFQGVVTLTNALGGVPVCVDNNVYDPYSHLKLTKGSHEVKGLSALEFVRTRHGFGDGGDIGRTGAQHLFLSALIRSMRSSSTLTDLPKLYDVANAGTSALTVDKGLAGVENLMSFVKELNKVPTSKINFVTMPTVMDPYNTEAVIPAKSTATLWQRLQQDTWPTPAKKKATPSSSSAPASSSTTSSASSSSTSTEDAGDTADAEGCAHVSTQYTVAINGVGMTPIQAFDAAPKVPLSAK